MNYAQNQLLLEIIVLDWPVFITGLANSRNAKNRQLTYKQTNPVWVQKFEP
jgi:hypothetical protein